MAEELSNARIDQLPPCAELKPGYFGVVRNMDNSVTERFDFSELLTSTTSGNFEWITDYAYTDGEVVTWQGEWYQANGDIEENIVPGTDPAWEVISKSPSGFTFWQAGVYTQDDVFVLYKMSPDPDAPDIQIFWLKNTTRPFASVNFLTELDAGDWVMISGGGEGGGEGGGSGIIERAWKFVANTSPADPGNGFFRMNNTDVTLVTELYFAEVAAASFDAAALFGVLEVGNRIVAQQRNDSTRIIVFEIAAAPVDNGSWWTIGVNVVDSGGLLFVASAEVTFLFDLSRPATTIPNASETVKGIIEIATQAETNTGTDDTTAITPLKLSVWPGKQGLGLSVLGVTGNVTANQASIVGIADQVLRVNGAGTSLGFGAIDLSKAATVGSSILSIANGGTGSATFTGWKTTGASAITNPTITGAWTNVTAGITYDYAGNGMNVSQNGANTSVALTLNANVSQVRVADQTGTLKGRLIYNGYVGLESLDTTMPVRIAIPVVSAASGAFVIMNIKDAGTAFNPSSGTASFTSFLINPNYSVTGGTTMVIGIDYNPGLITMTGATHYAAIFRSGIVGIGNATPGYCLDIKAQPGVLALLRLQTTVGTDILKIDTGGELRFGAGSAPYIAPAIAGSVSTAGTGFRFLAGSGAMLFTTDPSTSNNTMYIFGTSGQTTKTIGPSGGGTFFVVNPPINNINSTLSTTNYSIFSVNPAYNFTGGTTVITGIDYNPTLTAVVGATHNAALFRSGLVGIGVGTSPTALLDIGASDATKSSFRIRSGVAPTAPNDGEIWFDNTNLYIRIAGTTKTFNLT